MKTVAAIKNELFKDYLKVVSTDNLEQTLDNPAVPLPFTCVASVQNPNSDQIAAEINKFFEHRKLKGKDFLAMGDEDIAQLQFLFNLVQLSGGGSATTVAAPVAPAAVVEKPVKVKEEKVAPVVVQEPVVVKEEKVAPVVQEPVVVVEEKSAPVEVKAEAPVMETVEDSPFDDVVEEKAPVVQEQASEVSDTTEGSDEIIAVLGIPKNSTIHFIKNEEVTATILDEKTVVFDGEELPIVDATKKAFKKSGMTGMALGLANWNYEGTSLKALKDKN